MFQCRMNTLLRCLVADFGTVNLGRPRRNFGGQKLTRVLIKCYGKSYAVVGLFAFSLVFVLAISSLLQILQIQFF